MAKQKTTPNKLSVTKYINSLPSKQKIEDANISLKMLKKITKLKPRLWSPTLIGFGRYHYKYESGHEGYAPQIAFSPQKSRQVFYVINETKIQKTLLKKLGKYKTGKVCLYINKLADIDLEILEQILIEAWKVRDDKLGC
jgi:hypothetical protein